MKSAYILSIIALLFIVGTLERRSISISKESIELRQEADSLRNVLIIQKVRIKEHFDKCKFEPKTKSHDR